MSVLSSLLEATLSPLARALMAAGGGGFVSIVNDGILSPFVTFTRASTATYFDSAGVMQRAAVNTPRVSYDPATLQLRGLLIEGQRTNLFRHSEDFTVSPWGAVVSGTSTRTNVAGARGFGLGLVTTTSNLGGLRQTITGLASGQVYCLSFYLESTAAFILLILENGVATYGTQCTLRFNPSTGSITHLSGFTSVTSAPLGGGRVYSVVLPAAGSGLLAHVEWQLPTSGDSFRIGRPQFEAGAFATSYIPTTTAAVTRAADTAIVNTLSSIGFNTVEGSIYSVFDVVAVNTTTRAVVYGTSDTGFNRLALRASDITINHPIGAVGTGASVVSLAGTPITANTPVRIAMAYGPSIGYSQNGATPVTNASAAAVGGTAFSIGSIGGILPLNGHIRRLHYYPKRLTNAQLQALTA